MLQWCPPTHLLVAFDRTIVRGMPPQQDNFITNVLSAHMLRLSMTRHKQPHHNNPPQQKLPSWYAQSCIPPFHTLYHTQLWYKHDLRLDDHPGLAHARASGRPIVPCFCFDPTLLVHLLRCGSNLTH